AWVLALQKPHVETEPICLQSPNELGASVASHRPGPDLPPEPLDECDLTYLNHCANDPGLPVESRVDAVHQLLARYLRPPANLARVRAVLSDPGWLAHAEISQLGAIAGWVPVDLDCPYFRVFWVKLFASQCHTRPQLLIRVS